MAPNKKKQTKKEKQALKRMLEGDELNGVNAKETKIPISPNVIEKVDNSQELSAKKEADNM